MKIFKEIGGRVWALWGLLLFLSTMFLALIFYIPCFIIKEPGAAKWHRRVSRIWMTFFLNLIGCPLKIYHKENYVRGKNYVIVCNHNSLMDVPVTTPFLPYANKTIAKKSFAYIPFFGWIYSAGSILVDRKNDASRRKSYEKMKAVLHCGLDMLIYPEGSRNRTVNPLKTFYDGAFRLAVDAGNDIVPVILFNTKKILPVHKFFFLAPYKIKMHILPPVSSENISARDLKEKIFEMMWQYYSENL